MPGVPSCKGCVACAKQKKKCDQGKPECSRCRRLKIPCIGAGKQRYKFVEFASETTSTHSSPSSVTPSNRSSISRSPSNERTFAVAEFAHNLEVKDLRYDLCWSYGEILREVPKRLGTNAALDASASALSSAMSGLSVGKMSRETYTRFGLAVKALRLFLADPGFVYTPETLCAIFLIWICQSWFGDLDDMVGHGPGIVRILSRVNPSKDSPDGFEKLLFLTIAGPVAFESLYDSSAELNPWLKAFVLDKEQALLNEHDQEEDEDTYKPRSVRYMGFLSCLVRLPELLPYDPAKQPEIEEVYESLHATTQAIGDKLIKATVEMTASYTPESVRHFALCQKTYALNLALELVLVGILHVYNPRDPSLEQKSAQICQEMIEICLQGSVWRPLGSGWSTICLATAWVAVIDVSQRLAIEDAWSRCRTYASGQLLSNAYCLLGTSFDRLKLAAWGSCVTPPPPPPPPPPSIFEVSPGVESVDISGISLRGEAGYVDLSIPLA